LQQAGCYETFATPSLPEAGFHLMGTARMGEDPENSVLNKWCEAHDAKGLFVIDGAAFVTAAAVNPTNTIQALALRTADHLLATG
jgi:choline dehydrogenase-like flavoprotein